MAIPADAVPCEVVKRAVQDSGLSNSEIARRMGWTKTTPDTKKVRLSMGEGRHHAGEPPQSHVTYQRATELINAMGLDPVEYGL